MVELTQEIVRELLDCDPKEGLLYWRERDVKWFSDNRYFSAAGMCQRWNTKNAGKLALNPDDGKGYGHGMIFGKDYQLHRVIFFYFNGWWPEEVDHIDGNPRNNKPSNLKESTRKENAKNLKTRSDSQSGYSGIYFDKERNKYQVAIRVDGRKKHYGRYDTLEESIKVWERAKEENNYSKNHGRRLTVESQKSISNDRQI